MQWKIVLHIENISRAGLTSQEAWGPPYGGWPFFPLILCSPQNYYVYTDYWIYFRTNLFQLAIAKIQNFVAKRN